MISALNVNFQVDKIKCKRVNNIFQSKKQFLLLPKIFGEICDSRLSHFFLFKKQIKFN
jgi:hypothetical protein